MNEEKKSRRGFAAMSKEQVAAIASKGGKAAHAAGTAHQFSAEEAREAGRKGGAAPHVRRGRGPRTRTESVQAAAAAEPSPETERAPS